MRCGCPTRRTRRFEIWCGRGWRPSATRCATGTAWGSFCCATGDGRNIEQQVDWSLDTVAASDRPYFLFINVGETHHPYCGQAHSLRGDWGNAESCVRAQKAALEHADHVLERLFSQLENYFAVICADHGDCWGENGLWGHGFYHEKTMEVPMTIFEDRWTERLTAGWRRRSRKRQPAPARVRSADPNGAESGLPRQ